MGFETIVGDWATGNDLLRLVADRIRVAAGHLQLSRQDLDADPLLGGTVAATRKALQRLEKRRVIRVV